MFYFTKNNDDYGISWVKQLVVDLDNWKLQNKSPKSGSRKKTQENPPTQGKNTRFRRDFPKNQPIDYAQHASTKPKVVGLFHFVS